MKLIHPSYKILTPLTPDRIQEILQNLEVSGRVCYRSEDKIYWNSIDDNSAIPFVRSIIKRGHESVIEHQSLSIKFIVDRGFTHELVRMRLASYSQESTRFCNYKSGVTFIIPVNLPNIKSDNYNIGDDNWNGYNQEEREFIDDMLYSERAYLNKLNNWKWTPQEARSVLPNSLKTEINMSCNLREWRHVLKLRTAANCHPSMLQIMRPLLDNLKSKIPVIFEDITY